MCLEFVQEDTCVYICTYVCIYTLGRRRRMCLEFVQEDLDALFRGSSGCRLRQDVFKNLLRACRVDALL